MQAVLGIDQAWNFSNPSGVALVRSGAPGEWHHVATAPTYQDFCALAENRRIDWDNPKANNDTDIDTVLRAATKLLEGNEVSIISVDMPLSNQPITHRREADNQVSQAFGAMGASTHSPTQNDLPEQSNHFRDQLFRLGYPLAVDKEQTHCLIETYPHPVLIRLLLLEYRLEYKVNNSLRYWPDLSGPQNIPQRMARLIHNLRRIHIMLEAVFQGLPSFWDIRPEGRTFTSLKPYEDALDALVCAWVGVSYLENEIEPFGDADAVIWIPTSDDLR